MNETLKLCAFSNGAKGGHPAAAVTLSEFGTETELLAEARRIGYDETVFAYPQAGTDSKQWRVRFFSHDRELQCGGASLLVLGALLGNRHGAGDYRLQANNADLAAKVENDNGRWKISVTYAAPWSRQLPSTTADDFLKALGIDRKDLTPGFSPMAAYAGASYMFLLIKDENVFKRQMTFDLEALKRLLKQSELQGVVLAHILNQKWNIRCAFPFSGVREEGASGAAVAALAGMLRDIGRAEQDFGNRETVWYEVHQGDEMGSPSIINVEFARPRGKPAKVWGTVRDIVAGQRDPRQDNIQPPEPQANNNQQAQNNNQNQGNQQPAPRGAGGGGPLDAGNLPPARNANDA